MWLPNWLCSSKRLAAPSPRPARRNKVPTTRLFLEPLEDRTLPSAGWAIATGGTGSFSNLQHISQPDPTTGDLYVTGYFNGTVTFQLVNGGTTTLTAPVPNPSQPGVAVADSYVAKVDPRSGKFVWAEQFGGQGGSWTGIAVDTNGNVYLSGDFDGTQQFGDLPTPLINTSPSAMGYICKVDPNGNFLWAQQFAKGTSGSYSEALAVDGNGNPYVTWWASSGTGEGFLSKYDTSGNLQWTQQLASNTTAVSVWCVTLDSSGNAYVGGYGQVPGNPVAGGFLAEYDTNGNMLWTQLTSSRVISDAIYQDPSTGKNYLYTAMGQGVQKWEVDGATLSQIWSESINAGPYAVAVDTSGNVYLTGDYGQDFDADPGPGVATLIRQSSGYGTSDIFVIKLDPTGNFLSAWSFGGAGASNFAAPGAGVSVDASGNIYTAGAFTGDPTGFDTGSQIVTLPPGGTSLFVVQTTQTTGTIFGQVFNDLNRNGVFDPSTEEGIPNVTVYLDLNNSGSYVTGDPTTTTDSQGYYHFTDVLPGPYTVRQIAPSGYTVPPTPLTVSVSAGMASEATGFADIKPYTLHTYSNTTAVSTSKGKPNTVSSLKVSDAYTIQDIALTLTVNNPKDNTLSIFLTGPNGTKISLGSTNQNGTITFQVPDFDYTSVKGTWTLEVDGLGQGGTLTKWTLNVDG